MIRRAWLVGLVAACAQAPPPAVTIYGVADGREPVVRVYLRSLGDWETMEVRGKGGLRIRTDAGAYATQDPVDLSRKGGRIILEPLGGAVRVGDHTYAGKLVFQDGYLVNHITLENYVLGVLRGELPLKRVPRAAAAAQAIAVRSYTLHYLSQDGRGFDLDDTTLYQRYVGMHYAPDDDSLRAGVQNTTGVYLSFRGMPLKTYYHSTCGGHTTDVPTGLDRASVLPMRGVKCEFCRASKYWRWSATIDDGAILNAAALQGPLESVEVAARGPGQRASKLKVVAGGGAKVVHANELRLAVGASRIRSTNLRRIEHKVGETLFSGGGWGHGVGLCQMGAIGMALEGRSGREIVAHYYPGASLRAAY